MRYLALCTDYDGTLATDGRVLPATLSALERLIASGRRLVLVTGRELDELQSVFPRLDLFEFVVAENGALLFEPATGTETALAQRPPDSFVAALRAHGVGPISVGRVIVATWEPHETAVLRTIRDQGLELQVIFNKGAVMVLPTGLSKATGLAAALEKMALSAHNAVAIGDAENDHALISLCECGVAVANALPTLKEEADFVTRADHGAGVAELIDELLRDDLRSRDPQLVRHHILLGHTVGNREVRLAPFGQRVLVSGPRDGTVRLAAGVLERLAPSGYAYCVIADHAGYEPALPDAVSLGSLERPPHSEEILKVLARPDRSAIVNLAGLPVAEREAFVAHLGAELVRLRGRHGRPHWLLLEPIEGAAGLVAQAAAPSILQVVHDPGQIDAEMLAGVDLCLTCAEAAEGTVLRLAQLTGVRPAPATRHLQIDEVLAWRPRADAAAFVMKMAPPGLSTAPRRPRSVASASSTSRV